MFIFGGFESGLRLTQVLRHTHKGGLRLLLKRPFCIVIPGCGILSFYSSRYFQLEAIDRHVLYDFRTFYDFLFPPPKLVLPPFQHSFTSHVNFSLFTFEEVIISA